jgi:hypothetical protein
MTLLKKIAATALVWTAAIVVAVVGIALFVGIIFGIWWLQAARVCL